MQACTSECRPTLKSIARQRMRPPTYALRVAPAPSRRCRAATRGDLRSRPRNRRSQERRGWQLTWTSGYVRLRDPHAAGARFAFVGDRVPCRLPLGGGDWSQLKVTCRPLEKAAAAGGPHELSVACCDLAADRHHAHPTFERPAF